MKFSSGKLGAEEIKRTAWNVKDYGRTKTLVHFQPSGAKNQSYKKFETFNKCKFGWRKPVYKKRKKQFA